MTKLCSERDTFTFLAVKHNSIYSTANSQIEVFPVLGYL